MNKKLALGLTVLTILVAGTFSACSSNKPSPPAKEVSTNIDKNPVKDASSETLSQLKYIIASMPADTNIEFNTSWETSMDGGFKATLEGKGENAKEEGYSHIVIEDNKSGKLTKLTLENEEKSQLTAKDLEWIDESNLFVIIGTPFGTVTMGGNIYKLNIRTGETTLYMDTANTKQEYIAVHKVASAFSFEKYVYEDENFIKGHIESGNLELK